MTAPVRPEAETRVAGRARGSLVELFAANVARSGGRVAVVDGGRAVTYAELWEAARRVAAGLAARGAAGGRVGVCLRRSHRVPAAILGILAAGGSYVPLDPAYPESRLRFLAEDSGLGIVLCDEDVPDLGAPAALLEEVAAAPLTGAEPPAAGVADDAYVIYTSGSTGRPKGVRVTHANVRSLLATALPRFPVSPEDCWSLFHSYSFDFSVWEMWGAFATGGRLAVVPSEATISAERFLRLLLDERVTVLNQVPSVFDHLVRHCESVGAGPAPRILVFGGERLRPAALRRWFALRQRPDHMVVNMYGITETTVHATFRAVTPADVADDPPASPIGRGFGHVDLHLLDEEQQPSHGGPGEIWLTGAGVAAGYLNRDELTRERFRRLDALGGRRAYRSGDRGVWSGGELRYLGRVDDQVKVRGHRIELGEVDAALRRHAGVGDAMATTVAGARGELALAALFVPAPGAPSDAGAVRRHLAAELPRFMVPAHVWAVEALPRLPSGKADRRAAAAQAAARLGAG